MRTTVALLAILLVIFVFSTEAGVRRESHRLKHVPIGGKRHRPRWKRTRKVFIRKDYNWAGKPSLAEIGDLPIPKRARNIRKNQHYINPDVLAKFRQVKDMKDFVRIFKPKGFTIRQEVNNRGVEGNAKDGAIGFKPKVDTKIYFQGRRYIAKDASTTLDCTPRMIPQSLQSLGKITYPSCVSVKRCGGCCPPARECVADKKTTRQIDVFEIFSASGHVKQVKRTLVDHSSCKCDCIVKASDCLPKQTYSKDQCQCECKRGRQACPSLKEWSFRFCDCRCKYRQLCGPGRQWDEKNCRCLCTTQPCPLGKIRNPENCRCYRLEREPLEPFRRDFSRGLDDVDTDDSSPDDLWGDF